MLQGPMGDWHTMPREPPIDGDSLEMGITTVSMNSKRQRRPSVRLGEIGEQSAESHRRKKEKWEEKQWKGVQEDSKGSLFQLNWGFSKQSMDLVVSEGLGAVNKMPKAQNEKYHGQVDSGIEDQSLQSPNLLCSREEHLAGLSEGVNNGGNKKVELDFRAESRKARHGNRRRGGGTRVSSTIGRLVKGIQVKPEGHDENEKGSGEDGIGEPPSNASYDVYTPEGFRHSDLETSDSPGDTKETFLAVQAPSLLKGKSINISRNNKTGREVSQNERDELMLGERELVKLGENMSVSNADVLTRSRQNTGGVLIRELEGVTGVEIIPNGEKHGPNPRHGVKAWLNGLGLSRYAQIFEIHEVDMDVLQLLTFDDLKEMGINAVGSRRKIYSSIQQRGKGFGV